jgi:glycosyltransferase involved in cell wall biosynthesis
MAKDKEKILVWCGGSYVSGLEHVALDVMDGLQNRDYEVFCIINAWNDGDFINRLNQIGIQYAEVPLGMVSMSLYPKHIWWTISALAYLPKAWLDFYRIQAKVDPDFSIFYNLHPLLWLYPFTKKESLIYHVHDLPEVTSKQKRIFEYIDRSTASVLAASENIKSRLHELGVNPSKVEVLYHGIHLELFSTIPLDGGDESPVRIGIVGQIGPWKGHEDLFRAASILKSRGLSFEVLVYGKGDEGYVENMKRLALDLEIEEQIHWKGHERDQAKIYDSIDICTIPSRFKDPFPLVALESGASGIPVVATRQGGLPESINHGETGFLVDAESPKQLADRLGYLITHPEMRKSMGASARGRIENRFTHERMIDDIEEILDSVAR